MATRWFRGTAMVALCAAALLVGGCGGGGSTAPELLAGDWFGALSLSYTDGGSTAGSLDVTFEQEESFVSGVAFWSPYGRSQSLAGPVVGSDVSLLLHFRCLDELEATTLTGTVEGAKLTITAASGVACPDGGAPLAVSGASGSLTHTSDRVPL